MYDCASDVTAFQIEEVALSNLQRGEMRGRRDANRNRLKDGLAKDGKPEPKRFQTQGSYAMRTMTQHHASNYDIDDAVFFRNGDLKGTQGADMSALDARKMVRDALDDGAFKTPPKLHTNCIRVQYNAGYQVDIPVFREVVVSGEGTAQEVTTAELASADWKTSDAGEVTGWFAQQVADKSPDSSNGRQLRRVTKLIKKFANSRTSWEKQTPSGFVITALVVEQYCSDEDRDDRALYLTMKSLRDRLNNWLTVRNPVAPSETIAGDDEPSCKFLRDRLKEAVDSLEPLFEKDCDRTKALSSWDKVFATTFFSDRDDRNSATGSGSTANEVDKFLAAQVTPNVTKKEGGGRFA